MKNRASSDSSSLHRIPTLTISPPSSCYLASADRLPVLWATREGLASHHLATGPSQHVVGAETQQAFSRLVPEHDGALLVGQQRTIGALGPAWQ